MCERVCEASSEAGETDETGELGETDEVTGGLSEGGIEDIGEL